MIKIQFLEIAQIELDEAVEFYNYEMNGLGEAFLIEVLHTLNRIREYPEAWPSHTKRTRRCLARRFPYGIIYRYKKDEILVVAVANHHRKPDYWSDRL